MQQLQATKLLVPMRRRAFIWGIALSIGAVVSVVLAAAVGPASIDPQTVLGIVANKVGFPTEVTWTPTQESIVWDLRIPRVILGLLVGAALAVSGAVLQAMVRNVLADPYVLGISSGASTGAAAAILFGVAAGLGRYGLPLSAFLGALATSIIVFVLARIKGQITSMRLLLSGIAIGYALSATTSLLVFASDNPEGARSVTFWILGSLTLARWDFLLALLFVATVVSVLLLWLWSSRLDALSAGDETALALGVRPNTARVQLLIVVSLLTGIAVAASGAIGFVGLVVPHLARFLVGSAHARVIPIVAPLGGILLTWADAAGRSLLAPRELPVGILTAVIGAPFLVFLVRRLGARQSP